MGMESAIRELTAILGSERVCSEPGALTEAETATFATSQRIRVIVIPSNREQLCQILTIANRHLIKVYPVSSGKNWGYGSRVPVSGPSILLDLREMNRIVDFNQELAYVTVEPGVTQRDLFDFLARKNANLLMDATGSSPDCSLIGNAMERGFGHTPYGDHFSHICGLEVVLANGEIIETGFAGLPEAKTGPLYRWGMGPSLDGLFSQSNFGIVTRMTIWLMPKPEYFQAFFFQLSDQDSLPAVIGALRPLRLNGTLQSAIHIGNDYKVMGGTQQFPWDETLPLSRERMTALAKDAGIARWSGSGALYGTRGQVAEARRLVRRALKGKVNRVRFLDDRLLSLASRFTRPYKLLTGLDLSRMLQLLEPVYGLLKGEPTTQPLASAYWRKRMPVPEDRNPDRDGCGLLWCAPVAPMVGTEAEKLTRLTEEILLRHGFEPMISLTLLTERCLAAIISITYDRHVSGEDAKAMACFKELEATLFREGFYPYRLGISSMDVQASRGAYGRLLSGLKNYLDPNAVLSPGRYVPTAEKEVGTAA